MAGAALEALDALEDLDRRASGWLHARPSSTALDCVMIVPAMACGTYCMPLTLLAFASVAGSPWMALAAGSATATVLCSQMMKRVFARRRPDPSMLAKRRWNLRGMLTNAAFPSGDTAQAASLAVVAAMWTGRPALALLAIPTAAGRVHFGAHWIGDTVGGMAVGVANAFALVALARRLGIPVVS